MVAPQIDNKSQRLLDDVARIVKQGGKVNEIRRVIDECRAYYKSQPGNQVLFVSPFLIPEPMGSCCPFSSIPPSGSAAFYYIISWRPRESWSYKRNSCVKHLLHMTRYAIA